MTVTNQRLVEILTTAMEKPEIANALIQRVINTLNKQPEPEPLIDGWPLYSGLPEPEPVAWRNKETGEFCTGGFLRNQIDRWQPLYTAPPQREWVGLTDEEIKEIVGPWGGEPIKGYTRELIDKIEEALRRKNT